MAKNEKNYFDEKSHQISVGDMEAFGIKISTRYDKASEMAEMLMFAEKVAQADLHHYILEIFYDSQAQLCCFVFVDELDRTNDIVYKFRDIASQTIRQYEIFGGIGHGPGVPDYY